MLKQFAYKQFGFISFKNDASIPEQLSLLTDFIKVLFLKAGGKITIDFKQHTAGSDTLFFINKSQVYKLKEIDKCEAVLLYYNRDFYCVEIHDNEVSCDGILYNNVYEIPAIALSKTESTTIQHILADIKYETDNEDVANEEMIRILLKQIIIKATRIWKAKHQWDEPVKNIEIEFLRKFSLLVEIHFKNLHTVADYSKLLFATPKNLNKKITQFGNHSPNEIIKARIMLEAKRLLAHTYLTIKEIGYHLGYEDYAYFIRLFTTQSGLSPQQFRKQYLLK
ncbi:MAG: AraC family transcriptional regulator [Flavobacterium sp.]|uniref:helix-turn-helix domain-containing protein n=1 Tax=Flavobacterium sp. TaxID=239 RepID=UPI0032658F97